MMSSNVLKTLACVCALAACTQDAPSVKPVGADTENPRQVFTVNYPLAYFAERIGDGSIDVVFPAPADEDPAYWSPAADVVADFQQADLVLLNGAGYASWIQRATLSPSSLVDTSAVFADELIPVDDTVTHSHGPGGDHSHEDTAFTTWLNMELASLQAHAVFNSLAGLHPQQETRFRERLGELKADLAELDWRLKHVAGRIGDSPLLFSHPVYQYLVEGYGLNGQSVHWEPQEMPDEDQWRELSGIVESHTAAYMIWEDPPRADTVSRLEAMGIGSVVFRPCGNRPATGDFLQAMLENVVALEQAFPPST